MTKRKRKHALHPLPIGKLEYALRAKIRKPCSGKVASRIAVSADAIAQENLCLLTDIRCAGKNRIDAMFLCPFQGLQPFIKQMERTLGEVEFV